MSYLVSIQEVHDTGGVGPLPGQNDVIEISGELGDLGEGIVAVIADYPQVRDFDLTITNQSIPFEEV